MMKLYAEREGQERRLIRKCRDKAEAKAIVDNAERYGSWPEGFDAVLVDEEGRTWVYVDSWEELG